MFAALMINLFVLALFYAAITILRLEHFKGMFYDEFGQVAVTVLIVILVIGGMGEAQSAARAIGYAFGSGACSPAAANTPYCASMASTPNFLTVPLVTWAESVKNEHQIILVSQMNEAVKFNAKLGAASSVSGFCNLMGVGVSVAGCSAYGVLRGPTGQLLTATGIGVMETKAEEFLLLIAEKFALTLIVPLGLILRCLHFTRKAGGTLVALGLSLYLVLPISIIMVQALCDRFLAEPSYAALASTAFPNINGPDLNNPNLDNLECDPFEPDEGRLASGKDSILHQLVNGGPNGTIEGGASVTEKIMFLVIVRTLLMGALTLTMVISSVRVLGHLLGSEVDVYAIARLS